VTDSQLIPQDYHADWDEFLTPWVRNMLVRIEAGIREDEPLTPDYSVMLRFLSLPLSEVRLIILGQDPYPQPGAATGRAFEVGTLQSWQDSFQNSSLQNIIRAVVKADTGQLLKFTEIRRLLLGGYPLLPPGELFGYWESQGVMLLNTAFSCAAGQAGSHMEHWKPLADRLLGYINHKNPGLSWFLWGAEAGRRVAGLNLKNTIRMQHPSRCFPKPGDFLYGELNCFDAEYSDVDWVGRKKVNLSR